MKQKKSLLTLAALCLAALVMWTVWNATRPAANEDLISFTVEVCHKDTSVNTFAYETDAAYLGEFLLEEGLISGTESAYGLYVDTVDGETADYAVDCGWWQLLCDGESSSVGVDAVVPEEGSTYTWVYTVG